MPTYLDRIIAEHRARAATDQRRLDDLLDAAADLPACRDMASSLTTGDRLAVISEIKRRSPSKGDLFADLDPAALAPGLRSGRCCRPLRADRSAELRRIARRPGAGARSGAAAGAAQGLHRQRPRRGRRSPDGSRRGSVDRGGARRRRARRLRRPGSGDRSRGPGGDPRRGRGRAGPHRMPRPPSSG